MTQLGNVGRRRRSRLVRVDAENREDAVVSLDKRKGAAAVVDIGANGEDSGDARLHGAFDGIVGVVECGEVRVGVDHAAGAGSSIRGKSGFAATIPSTSSAPPFRTRSQAR